MCRSLAILVTAAALAAPAGADAAPPNCLYDQLPDHVLFVGGDPQVGVHLSVSGGEIVVTHIVGGGGGQAVTCSGQTPTTTNTDTISVALTTPGEQTQLHISNPPAFAPGFSKEPFGSPREIEIQANLGDTLGDRLVLVVAGATLTLGDTGLDWNPGPFLPDRDVTLTAVEFLSVNVGPGETTFTAQGSSETGGPTGRPIQYIGGPDRDLVTGGESGDSINGGAGRDALRGATGSDQIVGGPGARDKLFGDAGPDFLFAKDGKRDKKLDCGPGGGESVKRDKGRDPDPISC